MRKINKLADGLIEDTLKEAADTFFGRRRNIEHEVSLFEQKVNELRPLAQKIEQTVQSLNFLLLEGKEVENFWNYLNIKFPLDTVSVWQLDITVPFGLTVRSRYAKLLLYVYKILSKLIEEYSHGKEVKDTEVKGRKLITVNYNFLQKWVSEINEKIDEVNYYHKPSDVLQFVKKMHVAEMEKEKIAGAPMRYSLDKELLMDKMIFSDYKLTEYPDLPRDNKTIKQIKQFASDLVKRNKQDIKTIIQKIAK
ncbi:hypothetical protein [Desulfovulcanus sp.]